MFSPWTIAGFGLAVGLGLVLVFPQASLLERLTATAATADERPDQLNIEYLKVFLRARPQALRLRGELARQLIGLGDYAQARDQLAIMRASADPAPRLEAAWLEYQIRFKETYAQPEHSPQRAQMAEALRQQLLVLLEQPLGADRLIALSQNALAAGDNATAKLIFARILQKNPAMGDGDAAKLAAQSLGLGDYDSSAAFYFQAMEAVTNLDAKRDYYMKGLRVLLSGGQYPETIAAADRYIGPLSNDKQTLLFLTKLAQSANQPAAAQRYVKQLLQLSMTEVSGERFDRFGSMPSFRAALASFQYDTGRPGGLRFIRTAAAAQTSPAADHPFDEEIYTLAFNVFLANSNLADARLLAQSAVRQRPDSAEWRKRLAQASEWSGLPLEATPQWLAYARLSGDEEGWDNALRTSGGSFDQKVLTDVLEHKLQSNPGNVKWLEQLLDQYENIGEPRRAIALLKARMAAPPDHDRRQRKNEMQRLVDLDLRVGDDDDALAVLRRMQNDFGPDAGVAVQIANRLYLRGKVDEAMAVLTAAAPSAPADNADFWRTYAEVARFLQADPQARTAYRRLLSSDRQNESDIGNLIALISERQPMAAAALAEFGYRLNGAHPFAVQALNFRNRAADWDGAQRFLDSLNKEQTEQLMQSADFLAARATIRQARKDLPGAAADLQAALAMRPNDSGLRASMIWIMIARRDTVQLQRALRLWAADAENDSSLWGPFAAANMSINRQPDALHWFRKSGFPRDDYLWLMSYAECLDATGQPDLAWRIRRRAWFDLRRPETLREMDPAQLRDMRDRLAALVPLFESSDDADRVLKALLRADVSHLPDPSPELLAGAAATDGPSLLKAIDADNGAGADPASNPKIANAADLYRPKLLTPGAIPGQRPRDDLRLSAGVRELALATALNRNEPDLARAWLATRFASQLDKPLWGELTLMLLSGDRQNLNQLLDNAADWLPMYDRIDAARLAGRIALAQTLAFDQLTLLPDDPELHLRLVNLSTDQPAAFSASFVRRNEYAITVAAALALRRAGLEGLMGGFVIGQAAMMMGMMALILRNFSSDRFISFEFFRKELMYPSLMAVGFLYNAAIWVDKYMFWLNADTSQRIIGPLRASVIYDLPVFLAYLSIIPGMAIFLLRMETDFVEYYDAFYEAMRTGASLETIEKHRNGMVETVRLGIFEIIKIQAIATLLLIVTGEAILKWLGISTLYLPLLFVDIIAAGLQVVLLGILNVFFYLDKRKIVLWLCIAFVTLNIGLTWLSLQFSPAYYGYGFAVSVLLVVLAGCVLLSRKLAVLEYETFMLQ